jgi:hypothetical protein
MYRLVDPPASVDGPFNLTIAFTGKGIGIQKVTFCTATNCTDYKVSKAPKSRPQIAAGHSKLITYLDAKDLREMQIEVRDLVRKLEESDHSKLNKKVSDALKKELANIKKLEGKGDGLNQMNKSALNSLRVRLLAIEKVVYPRKTAEPAPTVEPIGVQYSENPYDEVYY